MPLRLLAGSKKEPPTGSKTVIVCLFPYLVPMTDRNVARFAVVADYHRVIGDIFETVIPAIKQTFGCEVTHYADNSPFDEVELAVEAGLGYRSMNSMLMTERYGNYVFIGELVTDYGFTPSKKRVGGMSVCAGCRRCIAACPKRALSKDGVDKPNCLSYISQRKSEPSESDAALLKQSGLIWGCDICTDVCPQNRFAEPSSIPGFTKDAIPVIEYDDIDLLLPGRVFSWRGSDVVKRNWKIVNEG